MLNDKLKMRLNQWREENPDLPLHYRKYIPEHDYTGPSSWKVLSAMVPNNICFVSINYASAVHDWCYCIGGTEQDRQYADMEYYDLICRTLTYNLTGFWSLLLPYGLWKAKLYYRAVRLFGASHFRYEGITE